MADEPVAPGANPSNPDPTPDPNPPAPGDGGAPPSADPPSGTPKGDPPPDPNAPPKESASEVPEAYTLTAPEGQTLDQAGIELFTPLFKEAKLSNDLANKLVGTYASYQATLLQKQSESWLAAAKADKEFGGEKFDETLKTVQAAFAKFGSPELKQFIEATGLGNHPELIRAFAKIGAASREDAPASGTPAGQQPKTMAQILFPDQN